MTDTKETYKFDLGVKGLTHTVYWLRCSRYLVGATQRGCVQCTAGAVSVSCLLRTNHW